eukprot:scaffold265811_cov19-Prasinocladus_malaysianus.AAC.1
MLVLSTRCATTRLSTRTRIGLKNRSQIPDPAWQAGTSHYWPFCVIASAALRRAPATHTRTGTGPSSATHGLSGHGLGAQPSYPLAPEGTSTVAYASVYGFGFW